MPGREYVPDDPHFYHDPTMNDQENSLGGRLPLLGKTELDGAQSTLYETMNKEMVLWAKKSGFQASTEDDRLIGPFNPLLYSPMLGQGFMDYLAAERKHTTLSAKVREVIILSVGAVWQAAYELYAHTAVAEKAGLDAETVRVLAAGRSPEALPDDQRIAHEFSRRLAAEHQIDPGLYVEVEKTFGRKGVVDMVHLVSLYMGTSAMLNAFAVPVPEEKD